MTEIQVEKVLHKPNPWLTLIPFWVFSGAVSLAIGVLTILIMLGAAPKYHMNLIGQPDALMSEAPVQTHSLGAATRHDQEGGAARPSS